MNCSTCVCFLTTDPGDRGREGEPRRAVPDVESWHRSASRHHQRHLRGPRYDVTSLESVRARACPVCVIPHCPAPYYLQCLLQHTVPCLVQLQRMIFVRKILAQGTMHIKTKVRPHTSVPKGFRPHGCKKSGLHVSLCRARLKVGTALWSFVRVVLVGMQEPNPRPPARSAQQGVVSA